MNLPRLLEEVRRRVPQGAAFGTRWKDTAVVDTPLERLQLATAARIDLQGRRREQFWCEAWRVELSFLLRLTCPEDDGPQARPARLPCHTPCPHGAHPPLTIEKENGFDTFEDSHCLGGGVTESLGVRWPRTPSLLAAGACVRARHLETLVLLGKLRGGDRVAPRQGAGPGPVWRSRRRCWPEPAHAPGSH